MNLLYVSPSPHTSSTMTTGRIMACVLVALMPTAIAGCLNFGLRAALVLFVSTASAVVYEGLCRVLMKREQTILDGSAAVTGLLLGLNLPATIPLWQVMIGSFTAIVLVKQLFGGLGQNFANPAIVGRIVMLISFSSAMTTWQAPHSDAVVSATPLVSGNASYWDLFLGNTAGCIGETCAAAILLGGLYLCLRGIVQPVIPAAFLGTAALCSLAAGDDPLYQLLAGGMLLGAVFMATDYVTTPVTTGGKVIFGIGCGLLTFVIRQYGGYPEGVSFAILLMNLVTPLIDRLTVVRPFGAVRQKQEAKDHA